MKTSIKKAATAITPRQWRSLAMRVSEGPRPWRDLRARLLKIALALEIRRTGS